MDPVFPELIRPMLAVAAPLPGASEPYGYEFKWDGVRAVAYLHSGRTRLMSRNDLDVSGGYPELASLADALGGVPAILDGELVAYDTLGRPSFGRLQERMHVRDPHPRLLASTPVTFHVFDVLHLGPHSTLSLGYGDRRSLLAELSLEHPSVRVPPWFPGNGAEVLAASSEQGLEGVIAKRLDSTYQPGRRTRDWRKVKNLATQEVVLGGWRPGEGRREGLIGSLLLGIPDGDGRLRYAGHVGTGFTDPVLHDLTARVEALPARESPFADEVPPLHRKGARWIRPTLVGEVEHAGRTREDMLRHASWRGLRPDKSPSDVVRED